MWNPNIKAINITKLVQMIFSAWFGYFEYVGYLPRRIMLIVLNVSIWLLSTSTSLPNHGASSSEKSPARNFANHVWHVWSVTAPSPHTAQIFFFLHFSCVFTFLEIIKHNMPKMLLFSNILHFGKMATQKFTNFDEFFLMHTDMTVVTIQSNKIVSKEVKNN